MKKIEIEKLDRNLISLIHNDWAVLTVQDEGKVNGMTVNWVQMGWLWNKAVVTVRSAAASHLPADRTGKQLLAGVLRQRSTGKAGVSGQSQRQR